MAERLWRVRAESTNGRRFVPGDEDHCRRLFEVWSSPSRRGRMPEDAEDPAIVGPVGYVGVLLVRPDGEVEERWGVEWGEREHFPTLYHLAEDEWRDCKGCGRLVAAGQAVDAAGRCSGCVYAADPWRRWPRLSEVEETIPRPTKCRECGSGTKKERRYLPGLGWYCGSCASTVDARRHRGDQDG